MTDFFDKESKTAAESIVFFICLSSRALVTHVRAFMPQQHGLREKNIHVKSTWQLRANQRLEGSYTMYKHTEGSFKSCCAVSGCLPSRGRMALNWSWEQHECTQNTECTKTMTRPEWLTNWQRISHFNSTGVSYWWHTGRLRVSHPSVFYIEIFLLLFPINAKDHKARILP